MNKAAEIVRLRLQVDHLQRLLRQSQACMRVQDSTIHALEQRLKTQREGVYTLLSQHVALKEAVEAAGFEIHYGGHALPGETP